MLSKIRMVLALAMVFVAVLLVPLGRPLRSALGPNVLGAMHWFRLGNSPAPEVVAADFAELP
jgi:hypothetical protein